LFSSHRQNPIKATYEQGRQKEKTTQFHSGMDY
jgi:hypothetical protein